MLFLGRNIEKIVKATLLPIFQHPKYWLTLVWAGAIAQRARKEGRIKEDFAFRLILEGGYYCKIDFCSIFCG